MQFCQETMGEKTSEQRMNAQPLHNYIIASLSYELGLERSLKLILNRMNEFIPAEYIILFAWDRPCRQAFQILEISNLLLTPPKTMIYDIDMDEVLAPYRCAEFQEDVYIIDDIMKVDALKKDFAPSTGRTQRSFIIIKFYHNHDASFYISCRTTPVDCYTREHATLFHSLLGIFTHLFQDIIRSFDVAASRRRLNNVSLNEDAFSLLKDCPGLTAAVRQLEKAAATDAPVLILGETGVGKELIATALHEHSRRKGYPLVRVNCGALPESLLDAEFFGYERGAFTGAIAAHKGYFEQADQGTLFLDEVGELPLLAQSRLLRVLESHEVHRIGSHRNILLDFRLVAATNKNLEGMVEEGSFRQDLWYRLYGCLIHVPPLRHRVEDIPRLVQRFLHQIGPGLGQEPVPQPGRRLLRDLMTRAWPGNARELRNWVMRALIHTAGENSPVLLPPPEDRERRENNGETPIFRLARESRPLTMREMERRYVAWALEQCHGRIQGKNSAAELLDLNPATLRSRMRKLGIPFPGQLA